MTISLIDASTHVPREPVGADYYAQFAESGNMTAVDAPRKRWQPEPGEGYIGFTEQEHRSPGGPGQPTGAGGGPRGLRRNRGETQRYRSAGHHAAEPGFPAELARGAGTAEVWHRGTFEECGNFFAAGIPVCLDHAIDDGLLRRGEVVMLLACVHAGDSVGAAAVRWDDR